MLYLLLAFATQALVPAEGMKATYGDLGQVDLSANAEHCWKPVKDGRIGVAFGLGLNALIVETKRRDFEQAGLQPSVGMRIFARHNVSDAYPALVVGISGEFVTVTTDLHLVGSMFVEPTMPLTLYATETRMPAVTPHVWTNDLGRLDLLAIMECYDKIETLSI